jgi:capsular polysaccharide export protein
MRRFAAELREAGIAVTKVHFHVGEVIFFPGKDTVAFRGRFEEWPSFVRELMEERGIDAIFVFGDCRPLHRAAMEAAHERGARVWVFEEGYLRPNWITLERDGVNGHSRMPRDPEFYRSLDLPEPPPPERVGKWFRAAGWFSTFMALAYTHLNQGFPYYVHHRSINAWYHTYRYVRNVVVKEIYAHRERGMIERFTGPLSKRYFFVPLQVWCDYQFVHSPYAELEEFVEEVLDVFVAEADPSHSIVFKHHPMDRPFRDYTEYFAELERRYELQGRLFYVHDLDLPTLLDHSLGTITINSTVGMTSIEQGIPVKTMGTAIYAMRGLTHQGTLAEFLRDPGVPDAELYDKFCRYLLYANQCNGNYYTVVPGRGTPTGIRWFPSLPTQGLTRNLSRRDVER